MERVLVVDAFGTGGKERLLSRDVIGAGARTVASVLEDEGYDVKLVMYEDITRQDVDFEPDIVCVGIMTGDERAAKTVFERYGGALKVIGGPGAADPTALLKTGADAAVFGEAEESLPEFLSSREPVPGVFVRTDGGDVEFPGPRPPVPEPPEVDPSFVEAYPHRWAARVYLEVVRGCSNSYRTTLELPDGRTCTGCGRCREGRGTDRWNCPEGIPPGCGFCSVPSLFGPARSKRLGSIVREAKGLADHGVRRIVLSASDVLDYGRAEEPITDPRHPPPNLDTLEKLLRAVESVAEVVFVENVKACLVDRDVAGLLGEYCEGTSVSVGVETGDERLLRALGKPSTLGESLKAIELLSDAGLKPHAYFVYGLPGQDMRTAEATVAAMRKAVKLGAEKITVYRFRPLPASAFGDMPPGPSPKDDPASRAIALEARRLNRALKRRWVGKRVEAFVAEPSLRDPRDAFAWPVKGGPKIRIKGGSEYLGTKAIVEVTGVAGDKVVVGRVKRVIEEVVEGDSVITDVHGSKPRVIRS